jgi:hypothetical protein
MFSISIYTGQPQACSLVTPAPDTAGFGLTTTRQPAWVLDTTPGQALSLQLATTRQPAWTLLTPALEGLSLQFTTHPYQDGNPLSLLRPRVAEFSGDCRRLVVEDATDWTGTPAPREHFRLYALLVRHSAQGPLVRLMAATDPLSDATWESELATDGLYEVLLLAISPQESLPQDLTEAFGEAFLSATWLTGTVSVPALCGVHQLLARHRRAFLLARLAGACENDSYLSLRATIRSILALAEARDFALALRLLATIDLAADCGCDK